MRGFNLGSGYLRQMKNEWDIMLAKCETRMDEEKLAIATLGKYIRESKRVRKDLEPYRCLSLKNEDIKTVFSSVDEEGDTLLKVRDDFQNDEGYIRTKLDGDDFVERFMRMFWLLYWPYIGAARGFLEDLRKSQIKH